jgi:hypothetical protein
MIDESIREVADALLYEGYMLYPYRASSVKNRQRFNFGVLHPPAWCRAKPGADLAVFRSSFLVRSTARPVITVAVRFLQLVERRIGRVQPPVQLLTNPPPCTFVDSLPVAGRVWRAWQEAIEREITIDDCDLASLDPDGRAHDFEFRAGEAIEPLRDEQGLIAGVIVRGMENVCGRLHVSTQRVRPDAFRISLRIENVSADDLRYDRDDAMMRSLVSSHAIVSVRNGAFLSVLEPPADLEQEIGLCVNEGLWPVLAGPAPRDDTMLCTPIILYDHPAVAPESRGDLFDGTEIDEILSLRVLTLTDDEKREMMETDERARSLLERVEALTPEDWMRLHGVMREEPTIGEVNR